MPVIRFVREGRDVECYPGENLREVALREGIELYGLKGKLGNCGGCGQCITCFVDVEGAAPAALSQRTVVEEQKLRRRPQDWRLACQSLVQESLLVLTRPQVGLPDREAVFSEARARALPTGPTSWPTPPPAAVSQAAGAADLPGQADPEEADPEEADPGEADPGESGPGQPAAMGAADLPTLSATSGEAPAEPPEGR